MSERKQTPDILAEILGGPSEAQEFDSPGAALPVRPAPRAKAAGKNPARPAKPAVERKRAAPVEVKPLHAQALCWEHRIASFQEHKGWRLRFVDGVDVPDWAGGVILHEYIAQVSVEGWQVAGACAGQPMFGVLDKYQIYLKRLVP